MTQAEIEARADWHYIDLFRVMRGKRTSIERAKAASLYVAKAEAEARREAFAKAAEAMEAKAERARVAAIGGGMDPMDAELLDHEFSLAARDITAIAEQGRLG